MLKRMWIKQPSSLQTLHRWHGTCVLAEYPYSEGTSTQVYLLNMGVESMVLPVSSLSSGWPSGTRYGFAGECLLEELVSHGWQVTKCGWAEGFEWRSPRGISGSEWVSLRLHQVPTPVLRDAAGHGELPGWVIHHG